MNTLKVLTVTASVFAFLSAGKISDNRCSSKASEREIVESNLSNQSQISVSKDNKIQVALLLDTSNSMDGLIDQAKSRLWNIVNTLTTLKRTSATSGNCSL